MYKLLIVEDDNVTRKIIRSIVSGIYAVTEAQDGEEAVRIITEAHESGRPFDTLILDLELPSVSGLDALAVLRSLEEPRVTSGSPGTKVLIISGHTDGECLYNAHKLNFDAYLVKPIDSKKLKSELDRLSPPH